MAHEIPQFETSKSHCTSTRGSYGPDGSISNYYKITLNGLRQHDAFTSVEDMTWTDLKQSVTEIDDQDLLHGQSPELLLWPKFEPVVNAYSPLLDEFKDQSGEWRHASLVLVLLAQITKKCCELVKAHVNSQRDYNVFQSSSLAMLEFGKQQFLDQFIQSLLVLKRMKEHRQRCGSESPPPVVWFYVTLLTFLKITMEDLDFDNSGLFPWSRRGLHFAALTIEEMFDMMPSSPANESRITRDVPTVEALLGHEKLKVEVDQLRKSQEAQATATNAILRNQSTLLQSLQSASFDSIYQHLQFRFYCSPEDTLAYHRTLCTRRRTRLPSILPIASLERVKRFLSSPGSAVLFARSGGVRSSALDFAVDLLDAKLAGASEDEPARAIWALPCPPPETAPAPAVLLANVISTLLIQSLKLDSGVLVHGTPPIAVREVIAARSSWEKLFALWERWAIGQSQVIVVIDLDMVEKAVELEAYASKYAPVDVEAFLHSVETFVEQHDLKHNGHGGLKIVLAGKSKSEVRDNQDEIEFEVKTDRGVRMAQMMRLPKNRTRMRRTKRHVEEELKRLS